MLTAAITLSVATLWGTALDLRGHYPLAAHIRHDIDDWITDEGAVTGGLDDAGLRRLAGCSRDVVVRTIDIGPGQRAALNAACAARGVSAAAAVRTILAARVMRARRESA